MAIIAEDTVDGILKHSPGHGTSPKNSFSVHPLTLQEMMGAVFREHANQVNSMITRKTKNLNLAFFPWLPPHRTAGMHQAFLFPWLNHCGQNLTALTQKDSIDYFKI